MKILLIFCLIVAATDGVTTVTGYRGRSVQIKCLYTSGYEDNIKYLCRGTCPTVGYRDIPVQSGSPVKDTRVSLDDNTTAKVFTITITDLRPEDENTYWCGIKRAGYDIYTEIELQVKVDNPVIITVSHSTHSTHSMSPSTHAESKHPTTEFPTFTIIIVVSVVLALLLIGFVFTVALQRKMKARAKSTQGSSNHHVAPAPGCRRLLNPLYSTVLPPSVPSKIYCNITPPAAPFDYSQAVYSTVHHPSDSPDQDFYSTAQLPTIPSDSSVRAAAPSSVKSDESLMYSTLKLDTRSNSATPTVTFKTINESCDYATVNISECG